MKKADVAGAGLSKTSVAERTVTLVFSVDHLL